MENRKLTAKERMEAEERLNALMEEMSNLNKTLDEIAAGKVLPFMRFDLEAAISRVASIVKEYASIEEMLKDDEAIAEETTAAQSEETTAAQSEEATAAQSEETTEAQSEETTEAQPEEKSAAQSEEKSAAQSEEKSAAQSEETTEAQSEETTAAQSEETTAAQSEETTAAQSEEGSNENESSGFGRILNWIFKVLGVGALVGILIMLILTHVGKDNQGTPDNGVVDPTPDDNGVVDPAPDETPEVTFDMDAFVTSTANIAKTLTTAEDIAISVDIFAEKIGADKLEELVGKYGELTVQKAIAEYLAFVPEIKMNQYIDNKGLDFNLNAVDDYYQMLDEADKAYTAATGKNPNGALMNLEGYDTHKSNREAMKDLISESEDEALLTWYEAKIDGYDAMVKQNQDTQKALDYKEGVKLELVNNVKGSVNLLELQLEEKIDGTDSKTLKYTEEYKEFIICKYFYVTAN